MPKVLHILETCIYGSDLAEMRKFYVDVMGLRVVSQGSDWGIALRVSPQSVLLIFDPRESSKPNRPVPSHGASEAGHLAFEIEESKLASWRQWLSEHGIAIEREVTWNSAAFSIYFRDPAGNSVELMAGNHWGR
jgi:catechol-2,3-dioxygenase